jgi:hypothetical protein
VDILVRDEKNVEADEHHAVDVPIEVDFMDDYFHMDQSPDEQQEC